MTDYVNQESNTISRKRRFILILVIVVALLLVSSAVAGGLYVWNRQKLIEQVTSDLREIPPLLEKEKSESGSYPSAITSKFFPSDDAVRFDGVGSFDGTAYCVTGTLKKNTSIIYHIDSSNPKDPQPLSCADAVNLPAPSIPGNLSTSSVGPGSVSMTWSASTYAGSYTLQCAKDNNFTDSLVSKNFTSTIGICDGLQPQTTYYVRVRANNTSTAGKWSSAQTTKTTEMSVSPTNFTAKALSSSEIGYSWSPVSDATSYIFERSSDVNFTQDVVTTTVSPKVTSGSFSGLKPNTYYFMHVKATTRDFSASVAAFSQQIEVRTQAK